MTDESVIHLTVDGSTVTACGLTSGEGLEETVSAGETTCRNCLHSSVKYFLNKASSFTARISQLEGNIPKVAIEQEEE